jgi:ankyrin repeat protein
MNAAFHNAVEAAGILLESGAPVDKKNGRGWTALLRARGASVDAATDAGFTAPMGAVYQSSIEIVGLLRSAA